MFHPVAESLANNGALKVNDHLQVEGFSNVFAVGDCANVEEPKMAYHAELHAAIAVNNITNSLSGKALTSYRTGVHLRWMCSDSGFQCQCVTMFLVAR